MNAGDIVLRVADLEVRYGRTVAVRGVSLEVRRSETVCIVGPNGAGKSTILQCIAGGVRPAAGTVEYKGLRIDTASPESIARSGLSFVPEGRHVFAGLTVEENLLIGTFMQRSDAAGQDLDMVYKWFPRLAERRRQAAGKLSGGEQQMLVVARALMTRADTILIDEPSLGLAPMIVDRVYEILLTMKRERGLTLVANEQGFDRVLRFADRVLVLREGAVKLELSKGELADETAIRNAYFGFDDTRSAA
jgi:branched-chain amino acid transport system ATP-binding protein